VAGLIKREDVEAVRERTRIEDIVGAQVTLKPAGVGSMKGLCPFHDERTPSFTVRPAVGRYHCFGCGESGDAIAFVMKLDGLSFAEAVGMLADRCGVQLRYEESSGASGNVRRDDPGRRQRLIDANRVAAEYYAEQLFSSAEAKSGRRFLAERSFGRADAEKFSVGYAPSGWNHLRDYLQAKGYTQAELLAAGLVKQGQRGPYDAFRGRLIWPIRDTSGAVVGFGARKLYEEDNGPKFLNTTETSLYKKSQVLYGVDLAKKAIARDKRVVIVEGYTDVMAAHLSGVESAVATCGTAFGADHARIMRRLMGDFGAGGGLQLASGQSLGGEVIFTFDGDAAGQKAALRAFGEDQRFHAQTFVAVAADGMDPCDLRIAKGPAAVRALVDGRVPLFEFVIRTTLERFDLNSVEGRVQALRETAGYVAGIRDRAMQDGYVRSLAGWIGLDIEEVRREVSHVVKSPRKPQERHPARSEVRAESQDPAPQASPAYHLPNPRDPVAHTEHLALVAVLQYPQHIPEEFDMLGPSAFTTPVWRAIHDAIRAAGGVATGRTLATSGWVSAVETQAGEALSPLINQLSVTPLPEDREEVIGRYVADVIRALRDLGLTRQIADARSRLMRTDATANPDEHRVSMEALLALETTRRRLRETD